MTTMRTTASFELDEREIGTLICALEEEFQPTYATYGRRVIACMDENGDSYEGDPATALKRLEFLKQLNAKLSQGYEQTRGVPQ